MTKTFTNTDKTLAVVAAISFSVAVYATFGLTGIAVLAAAAYLGTCRRA